MKKAKISFTGKEIEFIDRDIGIRQIEEFAERGVVSPIVIYGPEGCGKTALFKQAKTILEEYGYHVIYVSPLAREEREIFTYTPTIHEIVEEVFKSLLDPYSRIVDVSIKIASIVMRKLRKPRIAILMDDIFQVIGLDKAEIYTKILLNLIEYPSGDYEKIVILVSTSEGVTRWRIGRHRWADILIMWNMSRDGFKQLYEVLPDPKPRFEDVWRIAGGNPDILERLYVNRWSVDVVLRKLIDVKRLDPYFLRKWGRHLEEAVADPDYLWSGPDEVESLVNELIERNLIIFHIPPRIQELWIDTPPLEKDIEIGIGRHVAWQSPLHREAVRRALEEYKTI
ncbi:ATPase [Ignisphaera aggregans DSM 17230]|uniref:ATPase n=1 Tax=Ignisphaera aggregans (strain DSM 17230 / JCM 13409 / AQ1.S1) TaxID=583356 RepID=E0SRW0_IGNAA|nr:ATPase [Ignisphaera aggregans DSM 17230]